MQGREEEEEERENIHYVEESETSHEKVKHDTYTQEESKYTYKHTLGESNQHDTHENTTV